MKQESDSIFPSENKLSKYRNASIMGVKEVGTQIYYIRHCIQNAEALPVTQNYSPGFLFPSYLCILWLRCSKYYSFIFQHRYF